MANKSVDPVNRVQQLREQFDTASSVIIAGAVSEMGLSASQAPGEEFWSMDLSFDAWRVDGGPLQTDPLTLWGDLSEEELDRLQNSIEAETAVEVRARVVLDNAFGTPQALFEELIRPDSADPLVLAFLGQAVQPITHHDQIFGALTLDRLDGSYAGIADWNGKSVTVRLAVEDGEEVDATIAVARQLWARQASWNERVQDFAVFKLLPLKNDAWLEDDEAAIDADQFKSNMALRTIAVYADGSFVFWHADADMFGGHSIQISGNLAQGLIDADIPG